MLVTVDAVVFLDNGTQNKLKVLLVRRGKEPFEGHYALPGGFPEMNELLEDAAKRELHEETGIDNISLKQFHAFDSIHRDPRGRNISIAFIGFTTQENSALKAGDDASEAHWFPIDQLPELAFDHKQVIDLALEQFRRIAIKTTKD